MPPKSPGHVVSTAVNTSTYFSLLPMYGYKVIIDIIMQYVWILSSLFLFLRYYPLNILRQTNNAVHSMSLQLYCNNVVTSPATRDEY